MIRFIPLPLLIIVISFGSCHLNEKHRLATLSLPTTPVPMTAINSTEDDYNSDLPFTGLLNGPIVFSTNRGKNNFDIICKNIDFDIDDYDGKISLQENTNNNLDIVLSNQPINNAIAAIKTTADELGPHLIQYNQVFQENIGSYNTFIFLYSSAAGGNQNIRFLHNRLSKNWTVPQDVVFLNSEADDAYPTFMSDSSAVFFCSNRSGDFDIYRAELSPGMTLIESLSDPTEHQVAANSILSSPSDDKCPMIFNNVMVFTSNRPGGYGGFDLYYSLLVNGQWTTPVNFGSDINTPLDEYRPTIKQIGATTNDLMIFSSNREGGMGGFDLYYVGIPKLITPLVF